MSPHGCRCRPERPNLDAVDVRGERFLKVGQAVLFRPRQCQTKPGKSRFRCGWELEGLVSKALRPIGDEVGCRIHENSFAVAAPWDGGRLGLRVPYGPNLPPVVTGNACSVGTSVTPATGLRKISACLPGKVAPALSHETTTIWRV